MDTLRDKFFKQHLLSDQFLDLIEKNRPAPRQKATRAGDQMTAFKVWMKSSMLITCCANG